MDEKYEYIISLIDTIAEVKDNTLYDSIKQHAMKIYKLVAYIERKEYTNKFYNSPAVLELEKKIRGKIMDQKERVEFVFLQILERHSKTNNKTIKLGVCCCLFPLLVKFLKEIKKKG